MSEFHLFTTYYEEANVTRRAELDKCLQNNINSGLFNVIHLLVEGESQPAFIAPKTQVVVRHQTRRQTFNDLFNWANQVNYSDDISVIANSDIYFDDTLLLVETQEMRDQVFALSRWNDDGNGNSAHWVSIDSQDVWIFKGPIKNIEANFGPGIAGADNRLAAILNEAGYDVRNPSKTIKAHHLHNSGIRNYIPEEKVTGQYLLIEPEFLEIT